MDRRKFIKNGCVACLSLTAISAMMPGCLATKFSSGKLDKDGISIAKDDFIIEQKGGKAYSSFIIVRNDALKYPICVYRLSEDDYRALWMRCTHQGAELQASGNILQCSAHGSEFTSTGEVRSGPADKALRSFPVTVRNNEIFIDLRKQS